MTEQEVNLIMSRVFLGLAIFLITLLVWLSVDAIRCYINDKKFDKKD